MKRGKKKSEKDKMKCSVMKEWIDNQIGDEGTKTISESMKINTSLTILDLGSDEKIWNEIERREWREWGKKMNR